MLSWNIYNSPPPNVMLAFYDDDAQRWPEIYKPTVTCAQKQAQCNYNVTAQTKITAIEPRYETHPNSISHSHPYPSTLTHTYNTTTTTTHTHTTNTNNPQTPALTYSLLTTPNTIHSTHKAPSHSHPLPKHPIGHQPAEIY